MKVAVRYYSKSGNTKNLAEKIAHSMETQAYPVDVVIEEDVDILFIGSSVYAGGVNGNIKSFIKSIDKSIGQVVHFGSSGTGATNYKKIKKLVEAKGLVMSDREFNCKGKFMKMNQGRPNQDDFNDVEKFAEEILSRAKRQGEK